MSKRTEQQEEAWQTANGNTVLNLSEARNALDRAIVLLDQYVAREDLEVDQIAHLHGLSRSIEILADNFEKSIESSLKGE